MSWAIRQRLEPSPRLVLLALADRADKQGLAWPSVAWLAEFCGFHRTTVMREMVRLVRLALIEDSGQRKGVTHRVKVWQLRMAEDGLPLGGAKRSPRKGRNVGDYLPPLKQSHQGATLSGGANSRSGATIPDEVNGRTVQSSHSAMVALNAGNGRTGATLKQLEPKGASGQAQAQADRPAPARSQAQARVRGPRVFEVAPDWQPPPLPDASPLRPLVEHWSPDELGEQVEQFRVRAAAEGVTADLSVAWQAHVWRVATGSSR
jgi:pyocin large subunit-like protein